MKLLAILIVLGLSGCASIVGPSKEIRVDQTRTYYPAGEQYHVEIILPEEGAK